jgi:hypothetical protein
LQLVKQLHIRNINIMVQSGWRSGDVFRRSSVLISTGTSVILWLLLVLLSPSRTVPRLDQVLVHVQLHILTSDVDRAERSASCPTRFILCDWEPSKQQTWGWVGLRASLHTTQKIKPSFSCPE